MQVPSPQFLWMWGSSCPPVLGTGLRGCKSCHPDFKKGRGVKTSKRRWSDNQRQLGPFTYSKDGSDRTLAMVLGSGEEEDEGCHLRVSILNRTLIIELPSLVKPWQNWVDLSGYEWATSSGYMASEGQQFGFSLNRDFLQIFYGPQTNDSLTTKSWNYFLPWLQKRFYRFSLYGLQGEHIWTQWEAGRRAGLSHWSAQQEAAKNCPSASFAFSDFDGENLTATTHIEEREWLHGTGWFNWLSWFIKPTVHRSLDIRFSGETGKRKGSWKGGTTGHSITLLPNELHQSAFERYCLEHDMTFLRTLEV